MKHAGVVTDRDVYWDFCDFDDTGISMIKDGNNSYKYEIFSCGRNRKQLFQEYEDFHSPRRIYSDEVEMAPVETIKSLRRNNGSPSQR